MVRLRRERPPAPVVAGVLPAFGRGERLLEWAVGAAGPLTATNHGLWLPADAVDGTTNGGFERVGWERIDRAGWREEILSVVEAEHDRARQYPLSEPRRLPAVVRERVTAAIVHNEHVRLGPAGGVRIVARRRPADRVLVWSLVFDRGLARDDPATTARAEQLLARAREQVEG